MEREDKKEKKIKVNVMELVTTFNVLLFLGLLLCALALFLPIVFVSVFGIKLYFWIMYFPKSFLRTYGILYIRVKKLIKTLKEFIKE